MLNRFLPIRDYDEYGLSFYDRPLFYAEKDTEGQLWLVWLLEGHPYNRPDPYYDLFLLRPLKDISDLDPLVSNEIPIKKFVLQGDDFFLLKTNFKQILSFEPIKKELISDKDLPRDNIYFRPSLEV